ncbi:MAG: hypothetical protein Q8P56_03710 [Candidatus Uhrbacteria bacterium]|nr:hypothetical protein [Candidatus Uhrbacteria bacterium]
MTLRLKIILSALGVVAVLLAVFSIIFVMGFFKKQGGQQGTEKTEQVAPLPTQEPPQRNGTSQAVLTPSTEQVSQVPGKPGDEIISLVLPFVERLGSYSNQGNLENLSDLLPVMSDSMSAWAQKQIDEQTNKPFQTVYHGVTTKSLQYTLTKFEDAKGIAELKISTQRKELIGSSTNARVYNQDIIVKLVKKDTAWVVDGAYWQ